MTAILDQKAKDEAEEKDEPLLLIPPQDLASEQSTLGAIMYDAVAAERCFDILNDSDFYREGHREIFRAMLTCHNRMEPVDLTTVGAELKRIDRFDDCGGPEYLTTLVSSVPTVAHVARYAQIVAEKSRLRRLITAGHSIMDRAYENPADVQATAEWASEQILPLVDPGGSAHRARHITERYQDVLDAQDAWIDDELDPTRRPSFGLPELDQCIGGLRIPSLSIIMGYKGFGKSTLLSQIVHGWAYGRGEPTAWFTTGEETEADCMRRIAGITTGLDFSPIGVRLGCRQDGDGFRQKVKNAIEGAARANVWINDKPVTWGEFSAQVRVLVREQGVKVVVLDYLERVADQEDDEKVRAMERIARSAQRMQSELGICFITASQVTEGPDGKTMARYSAQLENDATVLVRIDADSQGTQEEKRGIEEKVAVVRASKFGPSGNRFPVTRLPNKFIEIDQTRSEPEVYSDARSG